MHELDSMMVCSYLNHFCFTTDTTILNVNDFAPDSVPGCESHILKARLEALDAETPFHLAHHSSVDKMIRFYVNKRRSMMSRCLGLGEHYFPLFEEALDRHDLPLELKYLPVVESALNPTAKSRVGAGGLWQFMYNTGKMYGLKVSSYEDQRMDPVLSTEAACLFLKKLYERYGDWNLALAAYNAGPGNVNKAIRRSGGKKDFWEIRPFLPRETRSYVPAFIAVNYIMNHASDHNIYPEQPLFTYFECDTVVVRNQVRFDQVAAFTELSEEQLAFLNPSYRRKIIPGNGKDHILRLPTESVGTFIMNEDSIYAWKKEEVPEIKEEPEYEWLTYRVRSGDVLGVIAQRHGVSVRQLKSWNNIRGTLIHPGQKLKIKKTNS